jgi:transcriptional regulator PpsR
VLQRGNRPVPGAPRMWRQTAKKQELLGDIDAKTAARLIGSCSDIALLLDRSGTVLDVIVQDTALAAIAGVGWKDRGWVDTVTVESRDKIEALLRDTGSGQAGRWRQVNHPVRGAEDLPVSYSCVSLQPDAVPGRPALVAYGRDLRATVQLQRRLLEAQQAMERDYWRFREAETRYRTLFQTAPEAVLIADGQTLKLLEVNPAAERLLGRTVARLQGTALLALFDNPAQEPLQALVAAARTVGARDAVRARLAGAGGGEVDVSATLFRQDQAAYLLVRLAPRPVAAVAPAGKAGTAQERSRAAQANGAAVVPALFDQYVRQAPDALVFTDAQGRVQRANPAFAALAQLSTEDQARGEMLDRWLGRTGVELSVLLTNLRQHGSVGLFTTSLRGEVGAVHEVEISAAELGSGPQAVLAFAVRDIGRRLSGDDRPQAKIARTASELTELVGRVPMKDIVAETSDLIEQRCIETALQMTNDNRALAAQFLGLSRQSLYVKLRRYGLGDLGDNAD